MPATILLVEDHQSMRRALRLWLETMFSGYSVLETANRGEAVYLVQLKLPQVVVMDICSSGKDGLETMTQIKSVAPATQLVVLTTSDECAQLSATAAGATACVARESVLTDLQPTLTALLSP